MSKRQATVQITKDDPVEEDDHDEDRYGAPLLTGTWQKADEVHCAALFRRFLVYTSPAQSFCDARRKP